MSAGSTPGDTEDQSGTAEEPDAPEPPLDPGDLETERDADTVASVAPGRRRAWPGVVVRAVVVLVVAGIGYQLVVPTSSIVRGRLSHLAIARTGTTNFPGAPAHAGEQAATTGSLAAMEAATKAHPGQTGLYVVQWTTKASSSDGLVVVTFLLPDAPTASTVRSQLATSQLSPTAFSQSGLVRTGQWAPAGIAGAAGSLYGPAKGATGPGQVGVTVWQEGRVVALVEVLLASGSPRADATTAAHAEAALLRTAVPGFTLSVTRHPMVASVLWLVGTAAALLLVAGGPVAFRRRRDRRALRLQEELARTIHVRGATIVRKRHGT